MSVVKPYKRTSRQLMGGLYAGEYIKHPDYAKSPENYVRAFLLLQKDVLNLFEYVEPSDQNLQTYSFRIHELLMRVCIEVEANCKAILIENGYSKPSKDLDMKDYRKIEVSHMLSGYKVKLPHWNGSRSIFTPFAAWATAKTTTGATAAATTAATTTTTSLDWYQKYNQTKHNRHDSFHEATFEQMISALCGLLVLITAQFRDEDFMSSSDYVVWESNSGYADAVGKYFQMQYPANWAVGDRYDFNWNTLKNNPNPIQEFDYNAIP